MRNYATAAATVNAPVRHQEKLFHFVCHLWRYKRLPSKRKYIKCHCMQKIKVKIAQ